MAYAVLQTDGYTLTTTSSAISWNDAGHASGGKWWDPDNPTRLVIPEGVTEVELMFTSLDTVNSINVDLFLELRKNGVLILAYVLDAKSHTEIAHSFGILSVAAGDYFEIFLDRFTGSDVALDTALTFFSAATPDQNRVGFVRADLNSDTAINTQVELDWTVSLDTATTHNGSGTFTVPAGVGAAKISMNGKHVAFDIDDATHEIKVNGTTARRKQTSGASDNWGSAGNFGVIPVVPGDTITVESLCTSATLEAANTSLSIEWLPPVVISKVAAFQVNRTTNLNAVSDTDITYDDIVVNDNLGLSGTVSSVTVPAGATLLSTGALTRNGATSGQFMALIFRIDGVEYVRNPQHGADYNTNIVNALIPVTPGEVITVRILHDTGGASQAGQTSWWGTFYA